MEKVNRQSFNDSIEKKLHKIKTVDSEERQNKYKDMLKKKSLKFNGSKIGIDNKKSIKIIETKGLDN